MLKIPPNPNSWLPSIPTIFSSPPSTLPKITSTNVPNPKKQSSSSSSAGKIRRQVLTTQDRTKLNPSPDRDFYTNPRFVTHVDDGFIALLTQLYRERVNPGSEILDLMSSWVSHLPEEVEYKRVVGVGLNAQELARNKRLDYFVVKDLNEDQNMEFGDGIFDSVLCAVSVQYLQQSEKVFAEVFRILKPGGIFIVSFSNRLFYEKAISAWRDGTAYSRVQLVVQYFQCVEGFTQPEIIRKVQPSDASSQEDKSPFSWITRLLGLVSGSDPFYAVVSYKNFKPVYE